MNPIYSRRVRRVPPIVSLPPGGRRKQRGGMIFPSSTRLLNTWARNAVRKKRGRRRVQKGGMILPSRTKLPDYSWVKNALKKQQQQRRRKRR